MFSCFRKLFLCSLGFEGPFLPLEYMVWYCVYSRYSLKEIALYVKPVVIATSKKLRVREGGGRPLVLTMAESKHSEI